MTGRDRTTSLHFGPSGSDAVTADRGRVPLGGPMRQRTELSSHALAIVLLGDLLRDHQLLGEQLRTLPAGESEYHGKLQVMLSALRRMEKNILILILEVEGEESC